MTVSTPDRELRLAQLWWAAAGSCSFAWLVVDSWNKASRVPIARFGETSCHMPGWFEGRKDTVDTNSVALQLSPISQFIYRTVEKIKNLFNHSERWITRLADR